MSSSIIHLDTPFHWLEPPLLAGRRPMRKDLRALLNNERPPVTQRLMIGRRGRGRARERAAARAARAPRSERRGV
ncbi:hypothetical protein ACRRTK_013871 [Alexandromys fortis]